MKTWEMIKELMEHPEKKFKSISDRYGDRVAFVNDFECIVQEDKYGNAIPSIVIHREWEEVKEPVGFIELLEEVRRNPNLEVSLSYEKKGILTGSMPFDELLQDLGRNFYNASLAEMFLKGKFYIED